MALTIHSAQTDEQILQCWEVIRELRPHLSSPEDFLQQVKDMMQEGYRIVYITDAAIAGDKAVAYAGFRDQHMLWCGKSIYIDDLVTLPVARGKGYAGQLLDHVHQLALKAGKSVVHLDSGYTRQDAHRLYLQKGYNLSAHHFLRKLEG